MSLCDMDGATEDVAKLMRGLNIPQVVYDVIAGGIWNPPACPHSLLYSLINQSVVSLKSFPGTTRPIKVWQVLCHHTSLIRRSDLDF